MEAEEKIIANGLDQSNEDSINYNENGEIEDQDFEIDNEAVKTDKEK
jgi:hypothetical protein